MKFFRQLNIRVMLGVSALLVATMSFAEDYPKILHSAKIINDVRIEVVTVDDEGMGEIRITGENCEYCDRTFWFDIASKMRTYDYYGPIDIALMQDMFFVKGSVRVILADNWIDEVRYVEVEE